MDIVSLGMPFGLAFASGLNAYLPLLAYSISVRWLHLYKINSNFAFVTSNWFIALLALLTILDFVADKIPLIDHTWDAVHTVIRPLAGAVVAAAAGSQYLPGTHVAAYTLHAGAKATLVPLSVIPVTGFVLLLILLIGGALAFLSHTTKATTRLLSTLTTAGFLNIGLSFLEDVLVVIIVLLSLYASAIMLILLLILVVILVPRLIRGRNTLFGRRRGL